MHIVDMADPSRVARAPDGSIRIAGGLREERRGLCVTGLELRLYYEGSHPSLGRRALITAVLSAKEGSAECVYDEGYRDPDPLGRAARFVRESGPSALVERLAVSLADSLDI